MSKIDLTKKERELIEMLGDSLYTVEFIDECINRNDNVLANQMLAKLQRATYD